MIIICSVVISVVVVVIIPVEWLIPLPAYCDAGSCSWPVCVAEPLFSFAGPT